MLTEAQIQTREYLVDRYGVEDATLMMSLYELESNFGRVQTNDVSSASGQFQILRGTWDVISNHVKRRIQRGELTAADLPDGMTLDNMDDFEAHRFDFVDNAFFANQNMNYIEERYVKRANRARAKNDQPPVQSFSELTDDPAMRMFMVAGGHKDGPDIGRNGAGFGNMINPATGEIDMEYGMQQYEAARASGSVGDGKGHVFTYAMFASDKATETLGGRKLQLTPSQITRGMQMRFNRRIGHKEMAPWRARLEQADPGIDINSMTEDQIYERAALLDNTRVYGANDIKTADGGFEVLNDPVYANTDETNEVNLGNEERRFSDNPEVAQQQSARVQAQARDPQNLGRGTVTSIVNEFDEDGDGIPDAIGDTSDTTASGAGDGVGGSPEPVAADATEFVPRRGRNARNVNRGRVAEEAPEAPQGEVIGRNPITGQAIREETGPVRERNAITGQTSEDLSITRGTRDALTGQRRGRQGIGKKPELPEPPAPVSRRLQGDRRAAETQRRQEKYEAELAQYQTDLAAYEARVAEAQEAERQEAEQRRGATTASEDPSVSGDVSRSPRESVQTTGPARRGSTGIERRHNEAVTRNFNESRQFIDDALAAERAEQELAAQGLVGDAEAEFNRIRQERAQDQALRLTDIPTQTGIQAVTSGVDDLFGTSGNDVLDTPTLRGIVEFNRAQADPTSDRITAGERVLDRSRKGGGDLALQIARGTGTNFDEQADAEEIQTLVDVQNAFNDDAFTPSTLFDASQGITQQDLFGINNAAKQAVKDQQAQQIAAYMQQRYRVR